MDTDFRPNAPGDKELPDSAENAQKGHQQEWSDFLKQILIGSGPKFLINLLAKRREIERVAATGCRKPVQAGSRKQQSSNVNDSGIHNKLPFAFQIFQFIVFPKLI